MRVVVTGCVFVLILITIGFAAYHVLTNADFSRPVRAIEERIQTSVPPSLLGVTAQEWEGKNADQRRRLIETWIHALEVGSAAKNLMQLPTVSTDLRQLSPASQLDGWAEPFCLARVQDRVLVLSWAGTQHGTGGCQHAVTSVPDVATLPSKKLILRPGYVAVLVPAS
jgi:hypothetical protein